MKNNSTRLVNVLSAIPKYYRLFEKQLDKYFMLETMDHVLRQTGSWALGEFIFKGKVKDGKLCLPCSPFNIRSVTEQKPYGWYEALYSIVSSTNANASVLVNYNLPTITQFPNPDFVQNQNDTTEVLLTYADSFIDHPAGKFVNYIWEDRNNILRFNSMYEDLEVDVIYTSMIADKEGFPYVKDAVIDAICYYNHYLEIQKDFFTKRADVNMLTLAKQSYELAIAQGRSPEFVSDNDWDRLLYHMTSLNRKTPNQPWRGR